MAEAQDPAAVMRIGTGNEFPYLTGNEQGGHACFVSQINVRSKTMPDCRLCEMKSLTAHGSRATTSKATFTRPCMLAGRRCFVSNLNWRTSWQDLKDKFRDCGEVVYANVVKDEDGE